MSILSSDLDLINPMVALFASIDRYRDAERFLERVIEESEQFEPCERFGRNSRPVLLVPIRWSGESTIMVVGTDNQMVRAHTWYNRYELDIQPLPRNYVLYNEYNYKKFYIPDDVYYNIKELAEI